MICFCICGLFFMILPYLWVLLMPLLASLGGNYAVLRFSIIIYVQIGLSALLPERLLAAEPLVQCGVLTGLLSMPMSMIPTLLVWCYDKLLWFSEPAWVLLEVIGVIQISSRISQYLVDRIDDQSTIAKGTILGITTVCYVVIFDLTWTVFLSDLLLVKWLMLGVLLWCILDHAAMLLAEEGIVSEAAMVSVWSVSLVYSMTWETKSQLDIDRILDLPDDASLVKVLWEVILNGFGNVSSMAHFLSSMVHPWFIIAIATRIYTVCWAFHLLKDWLNSQEDDESPGFSYDEDDDNGLTAAMRAWQSPVLLRLVLVFVYTQIIVQNFSDISSKNFLGSMFSFLQNSSVSLSRLSQIVLVHVGYMYKLLSSQDGDWSDYSALTQ